MTTDFNYNNKTINSGGPIKPSGKDQPSDPRTRVELYSDIESIPNPYVGMIVTVKADETNQNKMTDYKVISLKANSLGIANSVIDQVQRYVDYLGVSSSGSMDSGITEEQSTNISKIPTMEQDINTLKTTVGDNTSGLVKDMVDLKANGVSQDNIKTAVNNYLTEHPVTNGATEEQANQIEVNKETIKSLNILNFENLKTTKNVSATVSETVIKQEYLGGYIEIQPDSWDGTNCDTDNTTRTWGFPYSLLSSEQARIKKDIMSGNGKGIMYIRFPLGFAYRGYRNIDETSGLAKNIGERWKGQNATLKLWFEDIVKAGGGLSPEYWCPAPYWLTGGAYYSDGNKLSAGGSYDRTTTLVSIKESDSTQYNAQIDAFTDAIINDLEYLHQNIAPVRMFGLQNEPTYGTQRYGACNYDAQTYNDVLEVLYPKIQASTILSEYNDEPNEVKLLVASSDESKPFDGIAAKFIANHSDMIWGYTHHMIRLASGEVSYSGTLRGADWYKTTDFKTNITNNGTRTNVFCNEYEYFSSGFTGDTDDFRCSNNMLRLINELIYGGAKVLHPVIHICKPIGQNVSSTNTKGYSMFAVNLKGEYGLDITSYTNDKKLAKGTYYNNPTMYNSWKMFGDNLPINSYVIGDYGNTVDNGGWVSLKHAGKLYILMANNGSENIKITLTFSSKKYFKGKYYDKLRVGDKILDKNGTTIEFVVPAYSGQCWIEEEPIIILESIECTEILLSSSSLIFTSINTQTLTVTLTPTNTTDTLSWSSNNTNIVTVNNGVITPVSNGSAIITATCGNKSANCNVTVSLPTLQNISAVYTQGSTIIYPDTELNSLKNNLIVTGNYSDDSTKEITDYELSGSLTEGDSVITVTYNEKTTTFNVTVSPQAILQSIIATYTQESTIIYNTSTLDSLKNNLVVTANYSDGGTVTISDYILNGTLEVGTSTITVTYKDKTTTFDVIVTEAPKVDELITDALLVNFIAKNGCVGVYESGTEAGKTYLLDATSGNKYTDNSLSNIIYNDGDKYITLSDSNALSFGSTSKVTIGESYSLELCLLTSSIVKSSTTFIGSNANITSNESGIIFICRSGNIIEASYRPKVNSTTPLQYVFNATDEFIHLVAVVDKDNNKFNYYVNGVLNNSVDITVYSTESNALTLNKNTTSKFNTSCSYNAIRVYDKALSAIEVKSNYEYQKAYM